MKMLLKLTVVLLLFAFYGCSSSSANASDSSYANLGDLILENGGTLQDCKIYCRTQGKLNPDRSNIVLMLTWFSGTTQDLVDMGYIGDGKVLDTRKYFVIAVDAIGNGVSSSPSNSAKQPYGAFPSYTVKDMVNSQHILLTRFLNVRHVYAIAGISMGGMQAFQWSVSHPDFMDRIISINGSPYLSSYDMLAWSSELSVIGAVRKWDSNNDDIMKAITPIHQILVWSPSFRDANTKPEDLPAFIAASEKELCKYNAFDWESQLRAIYSHTILKGFDGSKEKAAAAVKARALVVTSLLDNAVYPGPSIEFAGLIKAQTGQLSGDCGHFSFICDIVRLAYIVNGFLDSKSADSDL
jgi:homoserine O-acetyltransferase/O-succinyltransferase